MTCITPLLSWLDRDNRARHDIPKAARTQGNSPVASQQTASGGSLLDRECDQFDWFAQVEVIGGCLVLTFASGLSLHLGREGIEVEPPAVGSDVPCTGRSLGKHDLGSRNLMLGAVFATASCRQPASLVAVVVNRDHRNRFTDNKAIGRQFDTILEGLPKSPELLVVTVCVDSDLLDHLVQHVEFLIPLRVSRTHLLLILPDTGSVVRRFWTWEFTWKIEQF